MTANTTLDRVRASSYKAGPDGHVTLSSLTTEEGEKLRGAVDGVWWMRGNGGRLEFAPGYEPPSAPTEDAMLPYWRTPARPEKEEDQYQTELFDTASNWDSQTASIVIQHLCGYSYTPEGYKANAEMLEECGFACLRSRRGDDGKFWEIWFLPGLWAAKGRLKEALYAIPKEQQMDVALKFLCAWTSWGTLDLSVQRLCQVLE